MFEFLRRLLGKQKRRETFVYTGDGMGCPEPGSLVGKVYIDQTTGERGRVVENTMLTVTVEFD